MKKKEIIDIKGKTIKELSKMVAVKKEEAKKEALSVAAGKEKNLKSPKGVRREIAQLLTIIREKEIMEKLQPKKEEEPKKK